MPQTSIPSAFTVVTTPGVLADTGDVDVMSLINAEASASMPFGIAVAKGTGDNEGILPAASNFVPMGVAVHDMTTESSALPASPTGAGILPKGSISALKRGRVVVETEVAVTPASTPFVRYASGAGGTQLGAFRNSADTATAADASSWCRFITTSQAVGGKNYAVLEVFRS